MFDTIKNKTMHSLIRYLSIFRVCYEKNGLRKGATSLSMTFGNVSKCISSLEEALQLVIIDPKKKKNIFTKEAKLLYECACKSEDLINILVQDFISINKIQHQKDNIITLNILIHPSLIKIFSIIVKEYSYINKNLIFNIDVSEEKERALLQLDAKVIDFAVFPFEKEIREIYLAKNHFREIGNYKYFIYYHKDDKILHEKLKYTSIDDIIKENIIPNCKSKVHNFYINNLLRNIPKKRINITSENSLNNLDFVDNGIGAVIAGDINIQNYRNIIKKEIAHLEFLEEKLFVALSRENINKKIILELVEYFTKVYEKLNKN